MAVLQCDEGMAQHCCQRKQPANNKITKMIKSDEVVGKASLMLLENKPAGPW